jgi:UDP-N-acetylglucosamine/UDP-N-acetylgalactosamine diphosphorylase
MPEIFALNDKVLALTAKGVKIPCPHSVEIGDDVTVERISGKGVVFHSGTKVFGGKTVIGSGVVLGHEAPLTAVDCVIGPGVELKGGYCRSSSSTGLRSVRGRRSERAASLRRALGEATVWV